jgi:F0F1-type ATP synthase delta subunit
MSDLITPSQIADGVIRYLRDSGHLDQLADIISDLQAALPLASVVRVESSVQLTPQQQQQISELLYSQYSVASEIQFFHNPDLIGGLKIILGDRVLDLSLSGRLDKLYAR